MSKLFYSLAVLIGFAINLSALEWEHYKHLHIQSDGRVIDRQNSDITHTEGIGYAMFFATCYNDEETFNRLEQWLENNMAKNSFGLYPWKWGEKENEWKVLDTNNATDGDIWIAYARLKASKRFNRPDQKNKALEHLRAIEKHLLYTRDGYLFLLPGVEGFQKEESLRINPSYYIPFIFQTFSNVSDKREWSNLIASGKILLTKRFSLYQIHPDWIIYNKGNFSLDPQKPNFSYDAIRIPLFWSIWYQISQEKEIMEILGGYRSLLQLPYSPIWINLSQNTMSLYNDGSKTMYRSLAFFSIISQSPIFQKAKASDEKNITYFSDSIAMFSSLPLDCYRE